MADVISTLVVGDAQTETQTVSVDTDLIAPGPGGSFAEIGANGGAGTLDVTGATLTVVGNDQTNTDEDGAGAAVGRGAVGTLNITSGGQFIIEDPGTTPINPDDYFGSEGMVVGRDTLDNAGLRIHEGVGTVLVDDGTLKVIGGAPAFSVGRNGGEGTMTFQNGSTFEQRSVAPGPAGDNNLWVGRGIGDLQQGNGTVTFASGSTGALVGSAESGSSLDIGFQGGVGQFNLHGASTFAVEGSSYGRLSVGFDGEQGNGGNGTLLIDTASTLTVQALDKIDFFVGKGEGTTGTVTIDGAGSKLSLTPGDSDGAQINAEIGRDGGSGTINVTDGGVLEIVDNSTGAIDDETYDGGEGMTVGRGEGSVGNINVTGAGSTFTITGGAPELEIGRNGGDSHTAEGHVLIDQGATFSISSVTDNEDPGDPLDPDAPPGSYPGTNSEYPTSEAGLQIGRQKGAVGTFTLDHGSTGTMNSGVGSDVYINVGRDTGNGTLSVLGGSTFTLNGDLGAFVNIGQSHGTGRLNVTDSTLAIHGGGDVAVVNVGRFQQSGNNDVNGGGDGTMVMTESTVSLDGARAILNIGYGPGASGQFTANGGDLTLGGVGTSNAGISIGDGDEPGDGGTGLMQMGALATRATASVLSDDNAHVVVGHNGGDGRLNLYGGTELTVRGNETTELTVGDGTGSTGSITIDGTDGLPTPHRSTVSLIADNADTDGSQISVFIGRDGGTGTLNVNNGGVFEIVDNSTEAILDSEDYAGSEYMAVGRDGGTGHMTVDNASIFRMTGGAPEFQIGRHGGTGTVLVDHGSSFTLTSVTDNDPDIENLGYGTSEAGLQIGREHGAVGTITFDHASTGTLNAGAGTDAYVTVGRDTGTGTFNLLGGSTFTLNGNDFFTNFSVGASGGHGTLNILGASDLNINGGVGAANLQIGTFDGNVTRFGGGFGEATIGGGSTVTLQAGAGGSHMVVGRAGDGTLDIDASTVEVFSTGGAATFEIGVDANPGSGQYSGTGFVSLDGGAGFIDIEGDEDSRLDIGRGDGSIGRLDVSGGASVWVGNADVMQAGGHAQVQVGSEAGSGVLNLGRTSGLYITAQGESRLEVGVGGAGLLDVNGAHIEIKSAQSGDVLGASVAFGGDGGSSLVTLRGGSIMELTTPDGANMLQIGYSGDAADPDRAGAGTLALVGGSQIRFDGGFTADASQGGPYNSLDVGGAAGSVGRLTVSGGSVIDMDVAGGLDSYGLIKIGTWGGTGSAVVDGIGSKIDNVDFLEVGYNPEDTVGTRPGSSGSLMIRNGGVVNAVDTVVGTGGTLGGFRGTLNGHLTLISGGALDLRDAGFGAFTLNGDLFIDNAGNKLFFDVGSGNRNDTLSIGDYASDIDGRLAITLNTIVNNNTYHFNAGEVRTLVTINSSSGDNDKPTWAVNGQHANFAYYGGFLDDGNHDGQYIFQALNNGGNGTGSRVLDFGLTGPAADVVYDSAARTGDVDGGIYGSDGGRAYNLTGFAGTNGNDTITLTGAAAGSITFDGRGGTDKVISSASYVLGANVENLTLAAGTAAINGTGNGLVNTLIGNSGNNIFFYDSQATFAGDTVTGGAGTDTIRFTSVTAGQTLTLSNKVTGIEIAMISTAAGATTGTTALNLNAAAVTSGMQLFGNNGNNIITGTNLADTLNGNGGNDTLNGGLGNDIFVFNTALNASTNKDTIDFKNISGNNDTFHLENAIFTKLTATGTLNSAFFKVGAAAADANDYIVYNQSTGALFYDSNGNGAGGAIQFAQLTNKPVLTNADFIVI